MKSLEWNPKVSLRLLFEIKKNSEYYEQKKAIYVFLFSPIVRIMMYI